MSTTYKGFTITPKCGISTEVTIKDNDGYFVGTASSVASAKRAIDGEG